MADNLAPNRKLLLPGSTAEQLAAAPLLEREIRMVGKRVRVGDGVDPQGYEFATGTEVDQAVQKVLATSGALTDAVRALGQVAEEIGTGDGVIVYENEAFHVADRAEFKGDTGGSDNTYPTLAELLASDKTRLVARLAPRNGEAAPAGNFTVINGEWRRQEADGLTFIPAGSAVRSRTAQDKARERRTILDKTGGVPDGVTSNRAALLAMIADGGGIIPAGTYVLDAPINLPADTILTHEGSPTIIYTGPAPAGNTGVLNIVGNRAKIRPVDNSVLTIHATNPTGYIYAVAVAGFRDIEIGNVQGKNCSHALFRTSANSYNATTDATSNHAIRVYGGGAAFDTLPSSGLEGALYLGYVWDADISGCIYKNCIQGIQWWGGNSDPSSNGAHTNPRKCGRITIRNVTVDTVALGCIWGSMGTDILVDGCRVNGAHDVGLDAEGCFNTRFVNCTAKDCNNGAAAAFFINEDLVFDGCTLETNNGPCFRNYNSLQNFDPRSILFRGCTFKGTGTIPSTVDTANGANRSISVIDCTFNFARLALFANNLNQIDVRGNRFVFNRTAPNAFDVIAIGSMHGFIEVGQATAQIARVLIEGNQIYGAADQPAGTRAVYVYSDDSNFSVFAEIAGNRLLLGIQGNRFAPMLIWHAGSNSGQIMHAIFHDNVTSGQIQTRSTGAAAPGNFVGARNTNFTLADVPLTGV